ncbi:MAG: HDOD domain-containing protein [Proteobacteria bacterium]|nr:HDOD domain-containing protein [Pseudomonadota bacterium]HQR03006.1 HDOD domain-containing protein [Rhodocyclaceae bacterium]
MNEPLRAEVRQAHIERQPVISRQGDTVGYELHYHGLRGNSQAGHDEAASTALLAHILNNLDARWLPEDKRIFFNTGIGQLKDPDFVALLPAGRLVLDLHGTDTPIDEQTLCACDVLRRHDVGLSVDGGQIDTLDPELMIRANYVKFDTSTSDRIQLHAQLEKLKPFPARKVARRVDSFRDYKTFHDFGFDLFQGYFFTRPEVIADREINTSLAHLVKLFELVGEGADPPRIETAFKGDPTLVLKLLNYINSAGMGLGRKVTSITQAIQILGYRQLYRWVALLLYTAGHSPTPGALMKTVLTRSRLIELLGQKTLPRHEQDNLFMIGMLSMLDAVFGLTLTKALAKLPIPDQMRDIILNHEGTAGRLLLLATALEQADFLRVDSLVTSLGLDIATLNGAHFEALGWAEALAPG